MLRGWRLTFDKEGYRPIEPCFANLTEAPGSSVHGVLHRLPLADLRMLDRMEGEAYRHADVRVEGSETGVVFARTYLADERVYGRSPSRRYLSMVLEGAREFALPGEYVRRLEGMPTTHIPFLSWLFVRVAPYYERARKRGFRPDATVLQIRRWLRQRGLA